MNNISSAANTDMTNKVINVTVDYATSTSETEFRPNWDKWNGYYKVIPELHAVVDKKAIWTVGKGYTADEKTSKILDRIRGNGKDTFNDILFNAVRTMTICGDFFAEIVKNKRGELRNLKPLNPGSIKIIANAQGIITRYEQWTIMGKYGSFSPENILHLANNRIADSIHGSSTIEKVEQVILARNEAMSDMKTVFHRYVKPLIISQVDTDDASEIASYKAKLDSAVANGENMVIPKDTATMERVSIPENSTLDPLPWIKTLNHYFIVAEGVPEIILGVGEGSTEATSKILYLAFQQMIEWNQKYLEEQLKAQIGIEINLEFPASIEPSMTGSTTPSISSPSQDNSKARNINNLEMKHNAVK